MACRTLCEFSIKSYLFTIACLEMGMAPPDCKKTAPLAAAASSSSGDPAPAEPAEPKKTLKQYAHQPWDSNSANQLQRASTLFGSQENYFIQRVVVRVLQPTSEYHSRPTAFEDGSASERCFLAARIQTSQ